MAGYAMVEALRDRNILCWHQGLGKTITALVQVINTVSSDRAAAVQIIVPNALAAERWLEELRGFRREHHHFTYVSRSQSF